MSLDPISAALNLGRDVINKIWPDPTQRAEQLYKLEELRQRGDLAELQAHVSILVAQLEVNKAEAQHPSVFVGGWRPALGWCCGAVIAYNYLVYHMLLWLVAVTESPIQPPPQLDMTELWPLILGMLGISVSRSWEKARGVDSRATR